MKRIYLDSNYLIIAKNADPTDDIYNLASNFYIEKNGTLFIFYRLTDNKLIESIYFADIVDADGNAYSSIDSFTRLMQYAGSDVDASSVPVSYSKQTANGDTFFIQKGQLNNLRLRPQIMNESAESSRNIQSIITSTNIVGQVIKASQDNINGINLTLESAAGVDFEDFESYVDSAALQAVWIATDVEATLNTTIFYEGLQAMTLSADGPGSVGDEWSRSSVAMLSGYTAQFWVYSNKEFKDVKMRVFLEDSLGNTSSAPITQADKDIWTKISVSAASLIADGITPVDVDDVIKIGFRVEKEKGGGYMIIDKIAAVPPGGEVEVKLWDMGTSIPVSTITALTDGTQHEKLGDLGITGQQASSVMIDLLGGKRMYHIDQFVAGVALEIPTNELLIKDHYYAITIHYVDTDVSVYGPNEAWDNYYVNGYGFTTDLESNPITAMGANKDIQFIIFSTQDAYVFEIRQIIDEKPNGQSQTTIYIEDENMKRTNVLISGIKAIQEVTKRIERPFFMSKGSKLEQEYNDDFTDSVSEINLLYYYYFIPPVVHG